MSFYEDNKYYIKQNLQVNMRGLSAEERKSNYKSISSDVRERIYKSYPKNNSSSEEVSNKELNIFYKELFELVGEFEINYILTNLFFEPNFNNITYYLKHNTIAFENLITPPYEEYTFKWFICLYLEEEDFFQSNLIIFLKKFIKKHIDKLLLHIEIPTGNNFQFNHSYPNWLITSLVKSEMLSKTLFIHLLVLKLFNIERNFIDNTCAIILLNNLSEDYEKSVLKGEIPNLFDFSISLNVFIANLFNKIFIIKTPIFDTKDRDNYSRGYYINRGRFLKKVQETQILNTDFINKSYSFHFEVFLSEREIIKQKIKNNIKNKFIHFNYPTNDDFSFLKQLVNSKNSNQIKKLFFNKLYMY